LRPALKTIEHTKSGAALPISFAGETVMLDPAGILFFESLGALVVSDLHLEKGSSFARRRQFLPPYDTTATLARLMTLVEKYDPSIIISLGDSFHDDDASHRLDAHSIETIFAMTKNRNMVWVTGNHDPSAPDHLPGDCVTEIALGRIMLRHIPLASEAGFEIAGHFHPCASIQSRGKRVRRPCFASDGKRMIMPSFGVLTGGLHLANPAFLELFDQSKLRAYMQGRDQIFPVAAKDIVGL